MGYFHINQSEVTINRSTTTINLLKCSIIYPTSVLALLKYINRRNKRGAQDKMKSKLIIFHIILATILLLAGCTDQPKPEDRLAEYTKLWNKRRPPRRARRPARGAWWPPRSRRRPSGRAR